MTRPAEFDLIEQTTRARYRERVLSRVAALLGLAVLCVLLPDIGPHRLPLAGVLVALTPIPVLLPVVFRGSKAMTAQSCFDVLSTGALIWFVPEVWAAGLVIVVASPAASAALIGRRGYVVLEGLGLALVGLAGWGSGGDGWLVPWAVAVMLMPLIASYVDVFLAQEHTASSYLADVVESSPVIFFEVDANSGQLLAVTARITEILGWTEADGRHGVEITKIVHPDDVAGLIHDVVDDLRPDGPSSGQ